jgi:hypothetical protein
VSVPFRCVRLCGDSFRRQRPEPYIAFCFL